MNGVFVHFEVESRMSEVRAGREKTVFMRRYTHPGSAWLSLGIPSHKGGFSFMAQKRCSHCHVWKEQTDFSRDKNRKDGLSPQCKACIEKYRSDHRDEIAASNAAYRASHKEEKAAYEFAHRKEKAAYDAARREEKAAYDAARYASHREEMAARNAEWHKANPDRVRATSHRRRARKRGNGGTHTAADVKRQVKSQNGRCWWCLQPCADKYHVDHLIPLAKGGHNNPSNIVISCPHCNQSKNAKTPDEFIGRLL